MARSATWFVLRCSVHAELIVTSHTGAFHFSSSRKKSLKLAFTKRYPPAVRPWNTIPCCRDIYERPNCLFYSGATRRMYVPSAGTPCCWRVANKQIFSHRSRRRQMHPSTNTRKSRSMCYLHWHGTSRWRAFVNKHGNRATLATGTVWSDAYIIICNMRTEKTPLSS